MRPNLLCWRNRESLRILKVVIKVSLFQALCPDKFLGLKKPHLKGKIPAENEAPIVPSTTGDAAVEALQVLVQDSPVAEPVVR